METIINKTNFFKKSFANFKTVEIGLNREPDFTSYSGRKFRVYEDQYYDYFIDLEEFEPEPEILEDNMEDEGYLLCRYPEVSSEYYYTEEGVYRKSDHWGWCRECFWMLDGAMESDEEMALGFCAWDKFFKTIEELSSDMEGSISPNNRLTHQIVA